MKRGGSGISNFEYNGVSSHLFGLVIGSVGDKGVTETNTFSDMEVIQDRAGNRSAPFIIGTRLQSNLEFPMEIYNKHGRHYESFEAQAVVTSIAATLLGYLFKALKENICKGDKNGK